MKKNNFLIYLVCIVTIISLFNVGGINLKNNSIVSDKEIEEINNSQAVTYEISDDVTDASDEIFETYLTKIGVSNFSKKLMNKEQKSKLYEKNAVLESSDKTYTIYIDEEKGDKFIYKVEDNNLIVSSDAYNKLIDYLNSKANSPSLMNMNDNTSAEVDYDINSKNIVIEENADKKLFKASVKGKTSLSKNEVQLLASATDLVQSLDVYHYSLVPDGSANPDNKRSTKVINYSFQWLKCPAITMTDAIAVGWANNWAWMPSDNPNTVYGYIRHSGPAYQYCSDKTAGDYRYLPIGRIENIEKKILYKSDTYKDFNVVPNQSIAYTYDIKSQYNFSQYDDDICDLVIVNTITGSISYDICLERSIKDPNISTNVASFYVHKTLGLGAPSVTVSIDGSGASCDVGFSLGMVTDVLSGPVKRFTFLP